MAWSDQCKIHLDEQVQHRTKIKGMKIKEALEVLSEESGIPFKTLERWHYAKWEVKKVGRVKVGTLKTEGDPVTTQDDKASKGNQTQIKNQTTKRGDKRKGAGRKPKASKKETALNEQKKLWRSIHRKLESAAILAQDAKVPISAEIRELFYGDIKYTLNVITASLESEE